MRDQRLDRWADVLVNYSIEAKKGAHAVLVGDPIALPLIDACYDRLIQIGANVECFIQSGSWKESLFKYGSDQQLGFTSPTWLHAVKHCDVYLNIPASNNAKALANVPPQKQAIATQAYKPILETVLARAAQGKLRWCRTFFPTPAAAQESDMGTLEFEEFVLNAGFLNESDPVKRWQEIAKKQEQLVDFLNTKKVLRFTNDQGTDLTVSIEGMQWVNCCGKRNFPDGEVFSGPNLKAADGGVNGVVHFSYPTIYQSTEVDGITIRFEKGAVVEAKATKNEAFLKAMIGQDPGAKFVGEIAIGTNYYIQRGIKNILFDEKIGGTFHLALGKGYPETGNCNESGLHWDLVCDLKKGGKIIVDGQVISENGRFSNPHWPQPITL